MVDFGNDDWCDWLMLNGFSGGKFMKFMLVRNVRFMFFRVVIELGVDGDEFVVLFVDDFFRLWFFDFFVLVFILFNCVFRDCVVGCVGRFIGV